jgi:aspartate/methionine/tyrosine aminotransferase
LRPRISARVARIEESVTLAVDARAKALRAEGKPVIVYGAGEPDFPTPEHIVERRCVPAASRPIIATRRQAACRS